jgi:chymotrypsin
LTTFGTAGTGLCGGSVISTTAILTAAHCSDSRTTQFRIIAGAINMRLDEPNQQVRVVPPSGWIQHPNYNSNNLANDIAVIQFRDQPLTLTNAVQVSWLAADISELFVGELVYASGFGRFSDSSNDVSDVLRFTRKTVITNASCRIRFPFLVQDSTICAIGESGINNSVCNGDSGGPLTVRQNGRSVQVGVVSFGSPLGCERDVPDGYARVTSFYEWIRSTGSLST